MKLTKKQSSFCEEFLIDLNAKQAAIRAGYSKKCAKVIGYENLTKPYLWEIIRKALLERRELAGYSREQAEDEYEQFREMAVEKRDIQGGVAAVRGKARLYGLDMEKREITGKGGGPIVLNITKTYEKPKKA